jgi:hypothetical protein
MAEDASVHARPEKPINHDNGTMNYPISILWAERNRVLNKIEEIKQLLRARIPVKYTTAGVVALEDPLGSLKMVDQQRNAINALQAKAARLGEAIFLLERN